MLRFRVGGVHGQGAGEPNFGLDRARRLGLHLQFGQKDEDAGIIRQIPHGGVKETPRLLHLPLQETTFPKPRLNVGAIRKLFPQLL